MSVNEVLARVGEIRARMELAPMRALAPMPAGVATARTGQVPDGSFQATLENVQNQALGGTDKSLKFLSGRRVPGTRR